MSQLFTPVRVGRYTLENQPGHGADDPQPRRASTARPANGPPSITRSERASA